MYILINLLNIINNKGRLYYDTKFFNTQISSHQLTIINNISNKKSLINRLYLFHAVLKKNKNTLFPLLQPLKQFLTPKLSFTAKAVGIGRNEAFDNLLVVMAEDMMRAIMDSSDNHWGIKFKLLFSISRKVNSLTNRLFGAV